MSIATHQVQPDHHITTIGLGLIGTSITQQLNSRFPRLPTPQTPTNWNNPSTLTNALQANIDQYAPKKVDLIWSAGQANTQATNEQLQQEYNTFSTILGHLQTHQNTQYTINFISSAGGLYENTPNVTHLNQTTPTSPYGIWKQKQETLLKNHNHRIYRITAIYGPHHKNKKAGLINNLIQNAKLRHPTTIYAQQDTQRDYLYSADLAQFIIQDIQANSQKKLQLLASGRPVTIDTLKNTIAKITNHRLKIIYNPNNTNQQHITYAQTLLPKTLNKTTLEEGIRLIATQQFR